MESDKYGTHSAEERKSAEADTPTETQTPESEAAPAAEDKQTGEASGV